MNAHGTITELDILQARVAALEQLLEAYEHTVAAQTERLLDSADRVKEQSSILRALVSATDPSQGGEFFRSIVYHLAALSQAKYVVLGEFTRDSTPRVQTLAVWAAEDFASNFSYELAGSPCASLKTERLLVIDSDARFRFPETSILAGRNIDSYCGAPIYDTSGSARGVLALMDDHPLCWSSEIQSVLMLFAARAGAELERRRAEEALRASEERYARATAVGKVGVWELDVPRGSYHGDANLKALFGYREDELSTDPFAWLNLVHLDDQAVALDRWNQVIEGQTDQLTYELRMVRKDGTIIWTEVRGHALRDQNGSVTQLIGATVDITERKLAEQALRQSRGLLQSFVEHTPAAVAMLDRELRYVAVSKRWHQDYRLGNDDIVGRHHYDVFPEIRQMERWQAIHRRCLAGEVVRSDEDRFQRADGKEDWLRWEIRPWKAEGGSIGGIMMFTEVVTERKRAEDALRRSEARLKEAHRIAGMGSWEWDLQTGATTWSDEQYRIFGYEPGSIQPSYDAFTRGIHEEDRERALQATQTALDADRPYDLECRLLLPSGETRHVHCRGELSRNEAGRPLRMIGTVLDITVRKQAEVAERRRIDQLLRLQSAQLALARIRHADLKEALRTISKSAAEALEVERVSIWMFKEDRSAIVCQDLYRLSAGLHESGSLLEVRSCPRYFDALDRSLRIVVQDALTDPRTSEFSEAYLKPFGITAMLDVPIRRQGVVVGVLCHEHVGSPRTWTLDEQAFATAIADMITLALETAERHRAQEQVRQSEERFRVMLLNSSDITSILEADGTIRYKSPAFYRSFGYSEEEVVGRSSFTFVHPDDLLRVVATFQGRIAIPGASDPIVFRYRKADGTYLTLETIGNNCLQDDSLRGIVVNSRDITERMEAEEALRRNHTLLSAIMEAATDIIFVKDLHGRYLHMNPAGVRLLGTSLPQLVGKADEAIWPADLAASCKTADQLVLSTGITQTSEETTVAGGKTTTYLTTKAPYRDGVGRIIGIIGVARNITEQKRAEEVLRQREQDLCKALQERERISQDLHDGILQSLYAVGLGLETCKSLLVRDPQKAAGTLDRGIGQLNSLMREVRNFIAGLESEVLQGRDLSSALRSVVESLAQPHHLPFHVSIERKAAQHVSREQSLHLLNVVREAVSNSLRHAKARQGSVTLKSLKHHIRLTVRDDGIGFRPAVVAGSGHGLTNMAARATKIGARLTVDSRPRAGTRIVFDLPKEVLHAGT